MVIKALRLITILFLISITRVSKAQPTASKTKTPVKTIWDIPHKTLWEKWMWPHRSVVYEITKERPINYDTAYIKTYYKRLVITLPLSTRFLQFSLIDLESKNKLIYVPNIEYDLGISLSSRWASFILNTGVKLFARDNETKGKTKYQDYQLNLYGRRFTTDMFVQYYSGFYIKNSKSFAGYESQSPYSVRPDVNALNMGVSGYYILNYKRFSYRNSFAFVEQQKKSAGSPLFGLYYSYFDASGSPSLVVNPFRNSFDTLSVIRSGHSHSFGLNIGYIYTLVFFKKCYATLSLVQGAGGEYLVYYRDNNSIYKRLIDAGKINVRPGFGYDNGRYFAGSMAMFDYYVHRGKSNSTFDYSFGKLMVYVGYRFSVLKQERSILKRLKLIDY